MYCNAATTLFKDAVECSNDTNSVEYSAYHCISWPVNAHCVAKSGLPVSRTTLQVVKIPQMSHNRVPTLEIDAVRQFDEVSDVVFDCTQLHRYDDICIATCSHSERARSHNFTTSVFKHL